MSDDVINVSVVTGIISDASGISGATEIRNIVIISQANYDALSVKGETTLYIITS